MSAIGWLIAIVGIGIVFLAIHNQSIGGTFASLFAPIGTTANIVTKKKK